MSDSLPPRTRLPVLGLPARAPLTPRPKTGRAAQRGSSQPARLPEPPQSRGGSIYWRINDHPRMGAQHPPRPDC